MFAILALASLTQLISPVQEIRRILVKKLPEGVRCVVSLGLFGSVGFGSAERKMMTDDFRLLSFRNRVG